MPILGYQVIITYRRYKAPSAVQAVLGCVDAVISALNLGPRPKCIRIFLNPQLFLSGFKNFPVHT